MICGVTVFRSTNNGPHHFSPWVSSFFKSDAQAPDSPGIGQFGRHRWNSPFALCDGQIIDGFPRASA